MGNAARNAVAMTSRRKWRAQAGGDPAPLSDAGGAAPPPAADAAAHPSHALPTLQRNALRKLFDRTEFAPEEVAALGVRRLRLVDGIGEKGIRIIRAWLAEHGCDLASEPAVARRTPRRSGGWTLQSAMRLLRTHGYEISAPFDKAAPAAKPPRTRRSKSGDDS